MSAAEAPVLVTGAGGFIGGRLVEVLHQLPGKEVRAAVRSWSSAARIGRLPVEIVLCDVRDRGQVRRAMEGAGAVVHCATGGPKATVDGLENILEAAANLGLQRVVNFSTIEVYGDVVGDVDEGSALVRTGRTYGDSKIRAEELCSAYVAKGVPVSVLRPSLVYGPFSPNWTIEIAQRLVSGGGFPSPRDADGLCNVVYVDDVVQATLLALEKEKAVGAAFNVNGLERITWAEYLEAFRTALELPEPASGGHWTTRLRTISMSPVRASAKWAVARFEEPIMTLYKRSSLAKRVMVGMEAAIRQTPTRSEYKLLKRQAFFTTDKAQGVLGYHPRYPLERGMELTVAWLKHHGFRQGIPELLDRELVQSGRSRQGQP